MQRRALLAASFAALPLGLPGNAPAAEPVAIAAAADLNAVFPELVALFRAGGGQEVATTFGSSGNFTQQIENGAPFQLFLSADESYVQRLARAGRTEGNGVLYATGRIGVFEPTGSPVQADPALADVAAALGDGRLQRFAIANPEHAPYGRAAREALIHAGLWDKIGPHLVLGDNVAQATNFAVSGAAQGGIIPLSLALSAPVAKAGRFALIPADWHAPLRQRAVLLKGAGPVARGFYDFLQAAPARALLAKYGFVLPDSP